MIRALLFVLFFSTSTSFALPLDELRGVVISKTKLSARIVDEALSFYSENYHQLRNKDYITIVDFNKHSGTKRLFVINTVTGDVESLHTSHGKNSDTNNDGIAESFSNVQESNKSTLGFTVTGETYMGKNGYSLRLHSMEAINSLVFERAIVMHGADYVDPAKSKMGRSFGCPALQWSRHKEVIDKIKDGSLFFFFHRLIDEARRNPSILMQPEPMEAVPVREGE